MRSLANRGVRRLRVASHSLVGRFWQARAGNIRIVFALLSVPMMGAVGLAVDYPAARLRPVVSPVADRCSRARWCWRRP